MEDQRVNDLKV